MYPADIDIIRRCLIARGSRLQAVLSRLGANSSHEISWDKLTSATLCSMSGLFDETGIVFDTAETELYIEETQPGYTELLAALGIARTLPDDWYPRVENGETFTVPLNENSSA